ncbi:MAG: signal peptidase I [Oscillospiraceae bacterium]|jgi:signal peptidase I
MKEDRSNLPNAEFLEHQDDDFDAIFESCKQEVSLFEEEQVRLREERVAKQVQDAESAAPPVIEQPAEPEKPETAEKTEGKPDKKQEKKAKKSSYRERVKRKQRMDAKGNEHAPSTAKQKKQDVYDWMQSIVMAMVVCIIVFTFFVRIVGVVGRSMVPTLQNGDKLIVSNVGYTPERGDIVIIRKDTFMEEPIVKRVIAVAGQEVSINFERGIVYVDGIAQEEPYINELTQEPEDFHEPITVPENCVFVMGDNRNHSTDSRTESLGCVDVRYIIGKVHGILYPGADDFGKRNFERIGSPYQD